MATMKTTSLYSLFEESVIAIALDENFSISLFVIVVAVDRLACSVEDLKIGN